MFGTVAMLVYCAMRSPVACTSAPLDGFTVPLRFSQSAAESGSPGPLRPPPVNDCHTPPSLPITTCWVSFGWNAMAWKSGCRSKPMFCQVCPPSFDRQMPPDCGEKLYP
jgi:hypothetical protein